MNKSELDAEIANAYGNLGHIKDVTNITIDDFKDEIVCTVSGHTAKTPMLTKMTLTFDRKEGCLRISRHLHKTNQILAKKQRESGGIAITEFAINFSTV